MSIAEAVPRLNPSEPFIRRPVATTLLTLGVALAGVIAYTLLPVAPLPQVDLPTISVSASMAGASPDVMAATVATPLERLKIADDPYRGRLLFAAKEAVYKAVYPLDRMFLEHHDVEVNLADRKAVVRNGRAVELRFGISSHILVLAFLSGAR